jgi:hypothetical protein
MIDIAEAALAEYGHTVTYKVGPFSRALNDAIKGNINAIGICNPADFTNNDLILQDTEIAKILVSS